MISISKKRFKQVVKLSLILLVLYVIGFAFFQVANFYKISYEKDKLSDKIKVKQSETIKLKTKISKLKKEMIDTNNKYIKKDELDKKIKDIFERMSILDYNLKYLSSKKVCVDNYILVAQLTSNNENGIRAGEGILSYLGEMKKHNKNNTIYFVNYISKAKEKK
jgi:cell division protein FtsB